MINEVIIKKLQEYLKNSQKIIITPHIDADGLTSAALFTIYLRDYLYIFPKFSFPFDVEITERNIEFYKKEDPDLIIFLDLSVDLIPKDLPFKKVIIDHHIYQPNKVKEPDIYIHGNISTSYTTFKTILKLTGTSFEKYAWIALIGMYGDKGFDMTEEKEKCFKEIWEIVKKYYPNLDEKFFINSSKILNMMRVFSGRYANYAINALIECATLNHPEFLLGKSLNSQQLMELYKRSETIKKAIILKGLNITAFPNRVLLAEINSRFHIQGYIASYLSSFHKDKVVFVANLGLREDWVYIEARCKDNSIKIHLGEFLKKFCEKIPEAQGGGHKMAAGCRFKKKYYEEFKKLIENTQFF